MPRPPGGRIEGAGRQPEVAPLRGGVELGVSLGGVVDDRRDLRLGMAGPLRGFDDEQQVLLIGFVFSHAFNGTDAAVTPQ